MFYIARDQLHKDIGKVYATVYKGMQLLVFLIFVKCIRDIDLTAGRLLLISVVRPTLEYSSEVWEGNKAQAAALESVMIGGAKCILGCLSRTCNEAVRGDMGLDSLQGRRDKAKLKWWYKVARYYAGASVLKEAFCAGVECQAT